MSQENVEIVRRAVTLGNAGDIDAVVELLYHPDAEARDLQPAPGTPEVMRGRAAIAAVLREWLETLDDWRIEVHEFMDAHPWVICDVHWYATGKGSGASVDWRETEAYEFTDGKVVRAIFNYPDIVTALEAVGLSEQDAHTDS